MALPRRLRVPPFLPAYVILALAIAYAAGTFTVGRTRLNAIVQFNALTERNAALIQDLAALRDSVNDIETGGQGFALTADESHREAFDRGRRGVPDILARLRDRTRDQPDELALIEKMVPLIAELTTISASGIERKRQLPDEPYDPGIGRHVRESEQAIRNTIAVLETRARGRLVEDRDHLTATIDEARRDIYIITAVLLLLVISLHLALRRLKAFFPVAAEDSAKAIEPARPADDRESIEILLRDVLQRARRLADGARAEGAEKSRARAVTPHIERALGELAAVDNARGRERSDRTLPQMVAAVARTYTREDGIDVRATIDRNAAAVSRDKAILVLWAASWALEAITLRKRAGPISLQLNADRDDVSLRISALPDSPEVPLRLAPREAEDAGALQQAIADAGGRFALSEGPAGLALSVTVPAKS